MSGQQFKKIVFPDRRIYRKVPWNIPVEILNNQYLTGQDLTFKKMIGEEPLTEEEQEKYPFVLNPLDNHKIAHGTILNLEKPYDKAIYDLIMISKQIAISESHYGGQPVGHVGYFFDELESAILENDKEELALEAQILIRELPVERYAEIIRLYNYISRRTEYIAHKGISPQIMKNKLMKAAREFPEDIKKCFPQHNEGIQEYSFVLELIGIGVITENARRQFFYQTKFLGENIDEVITNLRKRDYAEVLSIMTNRLELKKGSSDATPSTIEERKETFKGKLTEMKSLLFDGKESEFMTLYTDTMASYPDVIATGDFKEEIDQVESRQKAIIFGKEVEKFRNEIAEKELKELQSAISHHKTPYKKEDCEAFWEDETKLREYMVSIKYPNA